jgi:hypothetical protein
MEKSNDLIGNGTRDLPACNIVPQPTTLLTASYEQQKYYNCFLFRNVPCTNLGLKSGHFDRGLYYFFSQFYKLLLG